MPAVADVWIVALPASEHAWMEAWTLLSPDEQARAGRFHQDADRRRYVYSHAALRTLLTARLGCSSAALSFRRTASGKPELDGASLQFNLSRSGNLAIVGLCDGSAIGVDTEAVVEGTDYEAIARRGFSPAEVEWLTAASGPERLHRFYRLWVVREALVKAWGTGLSVPAFTIQLEIDHDTPQPADRLNWQAYEAHEDQAQATAAVLKPKAEVRWHVTRWEELRCGRGR